MKFIFTCGGTAGHINPALAVASEIKKKHPDCGILFIGAEGNMEMNLVPIEGYEILPVKITNISRERSLSGLGHNIDTVKNVIKSTRDAKKIIQDFGPDAVIGTGGYVCFPVISAAASLGIPTVIHESNAAPGLTTKLLSKRADRILTGVDGRKDEYPQPEKVIFTGTPVRSAFSQYTRQSARAELGIGRDERLVVSIWGSLGARFMNETVCKMLPMLNGSFRLVHATGKMYYEKFMAAINEACPDYAGRNVEIREYIHDMGRLMTAADLVMCRSGASTLSELAYMGRPAILVPSPNVAENHQEKNARVPEQAGGAEVILEKDMTPELLLERINALLSDEEKLKSMSEGFLSLGRSDAAERIADIVLELATEK